MKTNMRARLFNIPVEAIYPIQPNRKQSYLGDEFLLKGEVKRRGAHGLIVRVMVTTNIGVL